MKSNMIKINLLLFIIISSCSVIVKSLGIINKNFEVIWNIPSQQCRQYGITFNHLSNEYGIVQNYNDSFLGSNITILYDPGYFPAILKDSKTGQLKYRNGGVPQEGNLQEHLDQFRMHINEIIPNETFSGYGVIDFESWRPIYRQNFGSLSIYKTASIEIEKQRHMFWPKNWIEAEARKRWEEKGKPYVQETLKIAKEMRPLGKWGYYGFPYCFNNNGQLSCDKQTYGENDKLKYLWSLADVILPSVYLNEKIPPNRRGSLIRGRVREANRVANSSSGKIKPKIITYIRYVYTDTRNFLTEVDLLEALSAMKKEGSQGVILWGSSSDLNNKSKCEQFAKYVDDVLGPIVSSIDEPRFVVKDMDVILN